MPLKSSLPRPLTCLVSRTCSGSCRRRKRGAARVPRVHCITDLASAVAPAEATSRTQRPCPMRGSRGLHPAGGRGTSGRRCDPRSQGSRHIRAIVAGSAGSLMMTDASQSQPCPSEVSLEERSAARPGARAGIERSPQDDPFADSLVRDEYEVVRFEYGDHEHQCSAGQLARCGREGSYRGSVLGALWTSGGRAGQPGAL